ncbi:PREDICTED: uncharacterized protein LOC109587202 [Amphimedon queenslandica]|uniref:Death domain-containing protein n=1 Tax=Amphimedon queenslandica TaxID=400682 RepID=A0A1X7TL99_AMPQE|nr:PREDICTED: uncharacterized protein LOC109587202 [Amphimedon queenslandica]|eukprot:XP_019858995.1 PREDICTED: uncharacterized protein LOC109587202 [Amphimedon queenslandica]
MSTSAASSSSSSASPDFVNVCDKELDINDFHDVYDKVRPLSAHWEQIAISLRLRIDTIKEIQAINFSGKALSCLSKVLEHWLKKEYDYERYGVPCWRRVCVAVKGGGDPALAEDIARTHLHSSKETFDYEKGLGGKQQYLQDEFKMLIQLTEESFKSGDLPDIINYLQTQTMSFGPNKKTAKEIREEFEHISTIPELFAVLQDKYVSWFDYTLMKKLVGVFLPKIHLLKMTWTSYEEKLKDYFVNSSNGSDHN